ncbi:MAG: DUF3465 domain-containing protein [Candidatus Hydrogenedentes bacterium]|nr:DUF3465 domain-containing protein [Candidatus Hydrogenedentota bacterium]
MNKKLLYYGIVLLVAVFVAPLFTSLANRSAPATPASPATNPAASAPTITPPAARPEPAAQAADMQVVQAYRNRQSNIMVTGAAPVDRVLPDDNDGSRHQRLILQISSGKTLLIAHNIDLAPRIPTVRPGDIVEFSGEYEWNEKGGVVHWTHHDPAGRHPGGWLRHNGRVYQ